MLSFVAGAVAIINPGVGVPVATALAVVNAVKRKHQAAAEADQGAHSSSSTTPADKPASSSGGGTTVAPVVLEWSELSCSMTNKKTGKSRLLLDRVSGTARPGRLLGIMGPSGSGKTTLLNALAGHVSRAKGLTLSGRLAINGAPAPRKRHDQAYVVQADMHYSMCTVEETLEMATQLKLPPSVPAAERQAATDRAIQLLGLSKAAHTRVGDKKTRGLSGGEKKRLSIGCELVGSPSLIFLDEPTTGLDSAQAQQVMTTLKALASAGHTVVCSIHQPRSSIFAMLDDLLLLSDGMPLYSGPANEVDAYFRSVDAAYVCPDHFNPADFASDLISPDFTSPEAEAQSRERLAKLSAAWRERSSKSSNGGAGVDTNGSNGDKPLGPAIGWGKQFKLLFVRSWRQVTRDKALHVARAMSNVSSAVIFSIIFWRMRRSQSSIQDRLGLLQVAAINTAMASLTKTLSVFPKERVIVDRERAGNAYHVAPYLGAKLLAELPIGAIFPLLFGTIMYPATGLNPSPRRFLRFLSILTLESFSSSALGLAVGSFAPSPEAAMAIGPAVMVLFIVFGGFYKTSPVAKPLAWLPHVSLIKQSFEALCVNEFKDSTFTPDKGVGAGGMQDGKQVLQWLSFKRNSIGPAMVAQGRILAFYYWATFCILRARKPQFLPVEAASEEADNAASSVDKDTALLPTAFDNDGAGAAQKQPAASGTTAANTGAVRTQRGARGGDGGDGGAGGVTRQEASAAAAAAAVEEELALPQGLDALIPQAADAPASAGVKV